MTTSVCFWILVLLYALGIFRSKDSLSLNNAPNIILFLLMLLVGWAVFGAPLHK